MARVLVDAWRADATFGHKVRFRASKYMMASSSQRDAALLEACREHDNDAFGVFYERHRVAVLGYLARRVGAPELAADLMAETFASALVTARDPVRPLPDLPVAWLFAIAKNLVIDSVRRGRVEARARSQLGLEPLALDDHDLARITEIAAARDAIRDVEAMVPPEEWALFRARVIDEEPYPEIARRLRCSEAVVRKRVSRTRAHVRTMLGGSNA
jgi:RNA polymerase sigma-70 factor, ECF subfamily